MAERIWQGTIGGRELTVFRQPDGDGGYLLRVEDGHGLFEVSEADDFEDANEEAAIFLAERFARENPLPTDGPEHRAKKAAQARFWASVPSLPSMADDYQAYLRSVEAEHSEADEDDPELDMGQAPHR